MRLMRVVVEMEYVVDADNEDMVEEAKSCLFDDLMNSVKYDELHHHIKVVEAPDATEDMIPDFLLETLEEEEDE